MTNKEAAHKLISHTMECGMLMPSEWLEKNGDGSEFMTAIKMAVKALTEGGKA